MMPRSLAMRPVHPVSKPPSPPSDLPADSDGALLARIAAGEHAAFALLVQRHMRRFYALAYRTVLQKSEAEDIVQQAFLKLWEQPQLWRNERGAVFTTWFYRVVINLCRDHQRRIKPQQLAEDFDAADPREDAEAQLQESQRSHAVERALKTLPERQRTALILCFYEGLSNQEAAAIMGVRQKALESLLMRAKSKLREELHRWIEEA